MYQASRSPQDAGGSSRGGSTPGSSPGSVGGCSGVMSGSGGLLGSPEGTTSGSGSGSAGVVVMTTGLLALGWFTAHPCVSLAEPGGMAAARVIVSQDAGAALASC